MSQGSAKGPSVTSPGWQDYAIDYSSGGTVVGNGVSVARYTQIGTKVTVFIELTFGSTSTQGNDIRFTLPVTASSDYSTDVPLGTATLKEGGVVVNTGHVRWNSTTVGVIEALRVSGSNVIKSAITSSLPHTWGDTDVISATFTYEAATAANIAPGRNNDHGGLSGLTDDDHSAYPNHTEWASYTPTLTNLTIGNGTVDAKYTQIGETVVMFAAITLGSTSTVDGDFSFTLPVAAANVSIVLIIGHAKMSEASGSRWFGHYTSSGHVRSFAVSGTHIRAEVLSSTAPFTWDTGDVIHVNATYQASTGI